MTSPAPIDPAEIKLADLWNDPYPIFADLRKNAPVAFVPAANRYLVTRHADIAALERDPETFSAAEQDSLMIKVMGNTMLRKDGADHKRERTAMEPALQPRTVKAHWLPMFHQVANDLIDDFQEQGETDLFRSYAMPFASRTLGIILGFRDVADQDLADWSQALIDGTGNYGDDPEIWARARHAAAKIAEAVDAAMERLRNQPDDPSIVASMMHAADPLTRDEILGNVNMTIGGGLNEPRDSLAVSIHAMFANPEQRARVEADPALWRRVFEESIRWIAPIGMYPRQVAKPVRLGGVDLKPGDRLGIVLGSGNRDESVYENAENFDIGRGRGHLAFGGGPHFCLGAWAARAQVAEVALPTLFKRLPNLRAAGEPRWGGWVFRGVLDLPARWDR